VVATPGLLGDARRANGSALLAVDTAESVGGLRSAMRAGARGFFVWPSERDELALAAARVSVRHDEEARVGRARAIAVYGSRGGCGTTFLATHLASAFARLGKDCVLVDMDADFAQVSMALGVPREPAPRTIEDLAPVVHELSAEHLRDVLWEHPQGFRVLLAPASPTTSIGAGHFAACVETLSGRADVVLMHLPHGLDEVSRAGVAAADQVLVVLTLDVLSFHGARRLLAAHGEDERFRFVVNRAARSEIVPGDVERVFGRKPVALIPEDGSIAEAQDRGRLIPPRGRTGRAVARLARSSLEESA
jgi:pilus assembly protein CpaE